jgi:regulator of replication initiation timing
MEKLYEYSEGSGCNPALFDSLGQEGATVTAQDIGWLMEEAEQLRAENERLHELMSNVYKEQLRSPSSYVLARVEEIANEYKREFKQ